MITKKFRSIKIGSTFYTDQERTKKYVKMDSKKAFGDGGAMVFAPSFPVFIVGSEFLEAVKEVRT